MINDMNLKLKHQFLKEFEKFKTNFSKAAKAIKRSRRTVYNWLQEDEEFNLLYKDIIEEQLDNAEEQLNNLANAGDLNAIKFLLSTKGRARGYDTRIQLENYITLKDTTKPKNVDIDNLDKNEILKLREFVKKSKKNA